MKQITGASVLCAHLVAIFYEYLHRNTPCCKLVAPSHSSLRVGEMAACKSPHCILSFSSFLKRPPPGPATREDI